MDRSPRQSAERIPDETAGDGMRFALGLGDAQLAPDQLDGLPGAEEACLDQQLVLTSCPSPRSGEHLSHGIEATGTYPCRQCLQPDT